jgi:hypothetical protein
MRVLLRNLTLGLYYGGPGYWVMDLDRALEFDNIKEAERCFFSERMGSRDWVMEVLFVEGEARCGMKLPFLPIARKEKDSAESLTPQPF